MEIPETKSFIPRGFELGTTLSQPNRSITLDVKVLCSEIDLCRIVDSPKTKWCDSCQPIKAEVECVFTQARCREASCIYLLILNLFVKPGPRPGSQQSKQTYGEHVDKVNYVAQQMFI